MADVKEESKRYPLLEFEYDKGPYEKTLELSNQPGFVSYTSGNPDNYMHEGFGFSRGDDKKSVGTRSISSEEKEIKACYSLSV